MHISLVLDRSRLHATREALADAQVLLEDARAMNDPVTTEAWTALVHLLSAVLEARKKGERAIAGDLELAARVVFTTAVGVETRGA